ncbi:MAG: hypothetical protein ACREHE_12300 [Rhizomicrobium sp.]
MKTRFHRTLAQFAISAVVAAVTPAAAAGIVEGVSAAATTVSDAAMPAQIDSTNDIAGSAGAPSDSRAVTHAPTRLSALAGDDDAAWADARHGGRHAGH